jgi:hypothetical protein
MSGIQAARERLCRWQVAGSRSSMLRALATFGRADTTLFRKPP